MASFAELRDRLSPDVHKRGKQFERACKWFLETDPRYANRLSKCCGGDAGRTGDSNREQFAGVDEAVDRGPGNAEGFGRFFDCYQ